MEEVEVLKTWGVKAYDGSLYQDSAGFIFYCTDYSYSGEMYGFGFDKKGVWQNVVTSNLLSKKIYHGDEVIWLDMLTAEARLRGYSNNNTQFYYQNSLDDLYRVDFHKETELTLDTKIMEKGMWL